LVVIAIIGILIALLLPAVQAARGAARRASCANNLVQLSLALQQYESAHEMLPTGVMNKTGPVLNAPRGNHIGWIAQILPYIEQRNAFQMLDFAAGAYSPKNKRVAQMTISLLHCPSDRSNLIGRGNRAESNYAGCHHDVEAPIDVSNHGVLYLNHNVRFDEASDGLAHTIFVGEKPGETDLGWLSGTRATLRNTGTALNGPPPAGFVLGNPSMYPDEDWPEVDPESAANPSDTTDAIASEDLDPEALGWQLYVGGFGSGHSGGGNFAFGDGSIHFIPDTIDTQVYQRWGHRADGQLADPLP
jgi:prepilin-type processing-associated H-X9-DG protein